MSRPVSDQHIREEALDVSRSFILEAPAGSGKMHGHLADGVAVETASVFLVADLHPFVPPPVLGDPVVVGVNIQTRLHTRGFRGDPFGGGDYELAVQEMLFQPDLLGL